MFFLSKYIENVSTIRMCPHDIFKFVISFTQRSTTGDTLHTYLVDNNTIVHMIIKYDVKNKYTSIVSMTIDIEKLNSLMENHIEVITDDHHTFMKACSYERIQDASIMYAMDKYANEIKQLTIKCSNSTILRKCTYDNYNQSREKFMKFVKIFIKQLQELHKNVYKINRSAYCDVSIVTITE